MTLSSHRLKVEERKVYRKLVTTVVIFFVSIIVIIYAGIPLLTKMILFLSSGSNSTNTSVNNTLSVNPPILNSLAEATNSATISVSGTADKNTTVKISINDTEVVSVLVDKDSNFLAKNLRLTEGSNSIVATELVGNQESSPSAIVEITYKQKPPQLDISSPGEGQKFLAESQNINISGDTDPGNKVTINDRMAIVGPDGKFNFPVSLSNGDNNYKIVATDIAGNQTIIERKVSYTP